SIARKETAAKAEALIQARFDAAVRQPEENRALSLLSAADLLGEAIALGNRPLEESLRLHLGSWFQDTHRLRDILSHSDVVTAVAFSPDGKTLVSGCQDGTVQMWNTATGMPVGLRFRHDKCVTAVAFSPDGKMVVTGSEDKTARLWDVVTDEAL